MRKIDNTTPYQFESRPRHKAVGKILAMQSVVGIKALYGEKL